MNKSERENRKPISEAKLRKIRLRERMRVYSARVGFIYPKGRPKQ